MKGAEIMTEEEEHPNELQAVEIALVLAGPGASQSVQPGEVEQIAEVLRNWFPDFHWKIKRIDRPDLAGDSPVNPLDLLSIGYRQKLKYRNDVALVMTAAPLMPIANLQSRGIVSNALEVAVGRFSGSQNDPWTYALEKTALLLLCELWGEDLELDSLPGQEIDWSQVLEPAQIERIRERLFEISDLRVEEDNADDDQPPGRSLFLGAIAADPRSLIMDVLRYRPWAQPFRMARLTTAAGVSLMVLILAAESWEVGVTLRSWILILLSLISLLVSTIFLVKSQDWGWRTGSNRIEYEQEARTLLVISLSIGSGMLFFGMVLFTVSLFAGYLVTDSTLEGWIGSPVDAGTRIRYAVFTTAMGLLAATVGGNLEEEQNLKARLLVNKEIP